MLGGGSFTSQNQVLPGAYINFVSAARSSASLSERGTVTVAMTLDWGREKELFEVSGEGFFKQCRELFGYSQDAPQMMKLRELFLHATKVIVYRLNSGSKASNDYGVARYSGKRGNDIRIAVTPAGEGSEGFVVKTLLDDREVDSQKVADSSQLLDNPFVVFHKDSTLNLSAGTPMTGGDNGSDVVAQDHSDFLTAVETYSYHVLCCDSLDEAVKSLYVAFTRRMREEWGSKFQTVLYRKEQADYEGIISVENQALEQEAGLVYWVSGICAACEVHKSNENKVYNGELSPVTTYSQSQLSDGILAGKFLLHKVADQVRVLMDINTLTSHTAEKGEDFKSNQTIRVLDQVGNDVAYLFQSQYLGIVPNDNAGRLSLWSSLISYFKQLSQIRAIEEVESEAITVAQGETKRSVVVNCPVTPINSMSQLYMTVIVQ